MTKYPVRWQVIPQMIPADPEQRVKLWVSLLEKVKADVDARGITDWGLFADASGGYTIRETDKETLCAAIIKMNPYILCDVKPVLTVEKSIETLKKIATTGKK
ncbi:MAG: hypothetical protein NTY71_06970 [Methanoregula sp.]|nr:hypothetical protein [Methanoregula sp.]